MLDEQHRLLKVARPKGFEPLTSASGGQRTTATSPENPLNHRLRLHANGPEWTGEDWNRPQISTFSAQYKSSLHSIASRTQSSKKLNGTPTTNWGSIQSLVERCVPRRGRRKRHGHKFTLMRYKHLRAEDLVGGWVNRFRLFRLGFYLFFY